MHGHERVNVRTRSEQQDESSRLGSDHPGEGMSNEGDDEVTGKRGPNASSVRTKTTILDAALRTLRDEGIADTSARAIARAGNFNQALIFYHFGSVDDALIAAFEQLLLRQRRTYDAALAAVHSLDELRDTLVRLFIEDLEAGVTTTIAQGFAGATHRPHMGPSLANAVQGWLEAVELAYVRLGVSDTDARHHVMTFASIYLGYEVLLRLGPNSPTPDNAFDILEGDIALFGVASFEREPMPLTVA